MSYTFQSKFFGDKPMKRLVDAANDHAFNIRPIVSRGDHVSLIQAALFQTDSASIDTNELGQGLYGPSTAKAVAEFKRKRRILNHLNQIDNIVGINTMRALDQEMKRIDGGLGPSPAAVKTQDILVQILGQDPTSAAAGKKTSEGQPFIGVMPTADFNKEVQTGEYLAKHEPLIHQQWNGGLPKFGTDPTAEIVGFLNSTVASVGTEKLGRVILIGMSSGGRNAATVAHEMKGRNLFAYVAAIDAAFNDKNDPAIKSSVSAARSENFFQTIGNEILPGDEFHAPIPSFQQNVRLDGFPSLSQVAGFLRTAATERVKRGLVDKAHEIAVRHGYASAKMTAANILKS